MSSSTLRTADTADPERTGTIRKKDAPRIVSMDSQTGRMSAGTFQLVKLEAVNLTEMSIMVSYGTVLVAVTGDGMADELFQGGSAVPFQ